MLKTLIKKQFLECFRTYFVNPKTGEARKKSGITGMFVLFVVIMIFLGSVFFSMSFGLGASLFGTKSEWVYFALMGMVAIIIGTFGSVFNTYASLYISKDNEMLLSMPISPLSILVSRILVVYSLAQLYSGLVWIPALICYWIFGSTSLVSVVFGVLLIVIIALFVTVLTCILGWLVAMVASKLKNKSYIVVILSLVFFAGYYFICFKMTDYLEDIIKNISVIGAKVKAWGNLFYHLGRAASGEFMSMLFFSVVTLVLLVICIYVLSKSFIRIVTKTTGVSTSKAKKVKIKQHTVKTALLRRELKRFVGSSTYMLNCGFGLVFMPIIIVFAIIKQSSLQDLLKKMPEYNNYMPIAIISIICLITAINVISTPSVSLEGKNLWILRSSPIDSAQVLEAKINLHVLLNSVPAVITVVILGICVRVEVLTIVIMATFVWMFVWFTAEFGMIMGLKHVNLEWTNETTVIKQSLNILLSMLVGWALIIATIVGYFLLVSFVGVNIYLSIITVIISFGVWGLNYWLKTKGTKILETL